MTSQMLGYHVHGDGPGVRDKARLLAHVAKHKPRWMLVINDIGLALTIKGASPTTQVFIRWQMGTDNGYWIRAGAAAFLDHCLAKDPNNRLWHIGANEVNNVEHDAVLVEEMRRRIAAGMPCPRVGVCNYSVGQPADTPIVWDSQNGLTILKGASDFPAYIVVVLHDAYFMGYPLVGWQGNQFAKTDPKTWPVRGGSAFGDDGKPINWILGRHKNAVAVFRKAYPNAPMFRVVMGEAGPENIREFISTVGRELKGGWKNQQQYWGDTWGLPPDEALYLCVYWQIEAGYADSPEVEGVLLFAYGWNGDAMWDDFDLEPLTHFQQLVEAWQCPAQLPQLKGNIVQPPPPPSVLYPHRVEFVSTGYTSVNIRAQASTSATKLATAATRGLAVFSDGKVVDGWYALRLPATGERGFVSAQYVKLQSLPLTMKG